MFKTMHKNQQLMRQKPIIAVIGGAGPDAAIDIQIKLLKTMKERLNILSDQDHYRVIVDNNIDLPNRDMALLNGGKNPLQMYIQSANLLEKMGANILIISCNSAHNYFEEIQKSTSMIMINMIEQTAEYIAQHYREIKQVGLLSTLATIRGKLYHHALEKYDISVIEPDNEYQQKIVQAIYGIKAGFTEESFLLDDLLEKKLINVYQDAAAITNFKHAALQATDKRLPRQLLQEAVAHLKDKGANLIILGCTELPLVANNSFVDPGLHIIDPSLILARSTIQKCIDWENTNVFNERQAICAG